jgi:hypothetical protein
MKLTNNQTIVLAQIETAKLNGTDSMTFFCGKFKTSYSTIKALKNKGLISINKTEYNQGKLNSVNVSLK